MKTWIFSQPNIKNAFTTPDYYFLHTKDNYYQEITFPFINYFVCLNLWFINVQIGISKWRINQGKWITLRQFMHTMKRHCSFGDERFIWQNYYHYFYFLPTLKFSLQFSHFPFFSYIFFTCSSAPSKVMVYIPENS